MQTKSILSWSVRIIAAGILLQTLYFKFLGAEESVYIFSSLGIEPWGRIGTGIAELLTSILLLIPKTAHLGAIAAIGLMVGALLSHLLVLGIEVMGDGGTLFILGLTVLICALITLYLHVGDLKQTTNLVFRKA